MESDQRGATAERVGLVRVIAVSIHAPLRGATSNPALLWLSLGVSIHAPLRGATLRGRSSDFVFEVSIHAPLRGATPPCAARKLSSRFQSTRPCGARPCYPC